MGKNCKHLTVTQRRKISEAHCKRNSGNPHTNSEMLDLFLSGERVVHIAEAYNMTVNGVYNAISKEALYRLMEMQQAELLEEIDNIQGSN